MSDGRYRNYGGTDDAPIKDGDYAFTKFASRRQSTLIEPGTLEYSENMRLNRTSAKVREGIVSISNDLELTNPPLVLDFTLAEDVAVTSITRVTTTATVTTTVPHGYSTGASVNIRGADQSDYNGDFTITVTGASTFTYTVSGSPATPATGTIFANAGPVVFNTYEDVNHCSVTFSTDDIENDEYIIIASTDVAYAIQGGTTPIEIGYPVNEQVESTDDASMTYWNGSVYLFRGHQLSNPAAVTSLTSAAGTATLTSTAAHGLATGDWVFIQGASPVNYNGTFQITVTGASTFTYVVAGGPASPATGTITFRPSKIPLVWDGDFGNDFVYVESGAGSTTFIKMPPTAWGVDFKNRLVIPYDRDELLLSDFYDANNYDTVYQQLRIRGGTDDWLIGVHPYQESELIVLYHKSLHLLDLTDDDLEIASVTEITRNIGCAARRSVCTCGERILWLSERGVQSLVIGDLLSLRQNSRPLSDDIDDIIQRINWTASDTIVASYWNNRYYLAVPLDSQTMASTILVYNFLNSGWESVDTYPGSFNVVNFHVLHYQGEARLHCTTQFGFAYVMEAADYDEWGTDEDQNVISGEIRTRYYTGSTLEPKKFRRFSLETNLTTGDQFEVVAATKNPDFTSSAQSFTASSTTDVFYRLPFVGLMGTGAQIRLNTTAGRPEFRNVEAEFTSTTFRGNYNLS